MTTCFGLIILIFISIIYLGNLMLTVMLKRMIFIFLKFLKLSFLFFSVMREITEVCHHFITVVSLTNMSHFLIIIIGSKNFLDIAEHFIYFFDPNAWFSLYESQSPSYFICYNTTSPLSLGTVLQIDFDQLNSDFFISISDLKQEIYVLFYNKFLIISICQHRLQFICI